MRKAIAAIVLLTAFVLYAKNEVPPSLLRSDAPSIEIDVSVRPVTQDSYQLLERAKPGMYRCQAVVHEDRHIPFDAHAVAQLAARCRH